MYSPAAVEPTKLTALILGSSRIKSTDFRVPWMMLMTPSGNHASFANSARIMAAPGSRSEGLIIMVFPVMVAIGIDHNGIMAGKS